MNLRRGAALLTMLLLSACAAARPDPRTWSAQQWADEVVKGQMAPGGHASILKSQQVQVGPDGARRGLVLSFPSETGGIGYALAQVGGNVDGQSMLFDQLPKTLAIQDMSTPLMLVGLIGDPHITALALTFVHHEPEFKRTYTYQVAAPGFFLPVPPEVPTPAVVTFIARDAAGQVLASGEFPYPRAA